MRDDRIEIGDVVECRVSDIQRFAGCVEIMGTDCWVLTLLSGGVIYVQTFQYIKLIKKGRIGNG